jgi:hypothetical protein
VRALLPAPHPLPPHLDDHTHSNNSSSSNNSNNANNNANANAASHTQGIPGLVKMLIELYPTVNPKSIYPNFGRPLVEIKKAEDARMSAIKKSEREAVMAKR